MAEKNLYTYHDPTAEFGGEILRYPSNLSTNGIPFVVFAPYQRKRTLTVGDVSGASVLSSLKTPERCIVLPLPSSALGTRYGVNYKDASIGAGIGSTLAGGKNLLEGLNASTPTSTGIDTLKQVGSQVTDIVASNLLLGGLGALGALGDAGQGLQDALLLKVGMAPNPFTEVMFENVPFREHTFAYVFQPKSFEESQTIDKIVQYFKYYMLPALSDTSPGVVGTFLKFPLEWQIMYSIADTTFTVLPSVLTNMEINYADGVDSPKLFKPPSGTDKRYPTRINVTLTFKEVVLLTRNYISVEKRVTDENGRMESSFSDVTSRTRYRF